MMAARDVAAVATLLRRRCVLVAPGYDATPALVKRLEAALDESGAVLAMLFLPKTNAPAQPVPAATDKEPDVDRVG